MGMIRHLGNDDGRLVAGGETERQDGGHGCAKHAHGIPRKCARDSGAAIEAIRPIIRPRLFTIAPMLALDDCRAAFPAWGDQDDADRFKKRVGGNHVARRTPRPHQALERSRDRWKGESIRGIKFGRSRRAARDKK